MDKEADQTDTERSTITLDAFPESAVRYAVRDETIVLVVANDRFVDSFAAIESGTPFETWWAENDVSARDRTVADICSSLVAGDTVDVTVTVGERDGTAYRLRSVHEPGPRADGTMGLSAGPDTSRDGPSGEQIASVISHDLRNPLDVAKARTRAARETGDAEHFDRLEGAHDRMERIIRDVLTLARNDEVIEPGTAVELDTVATDAWATVDTGPATLAVTGDLPTIEADPDRLQRLFENLFRNSVEHSSTSNPTEAGITVRVGPTGDGFFVDDDGPGIPKAERERVFEPGYTVTEGGTGLGLTIVERIAEAHGWTVSLVESDDGGARFEFRDVVSVPNEANVEKP
jgi:hypothetical protein